VLRGERAQVLIRAIRLMADIEHEYAGESWQFDHRVRQRGRRRPWVRVLAGLYIIACGVLLALVAYRFAD
jgi:hypothetical protein